MKAFLCRIVFIFALAQGSAFASNTVVNLSHYDLMRVDFERMRQEGIVGVIHEATYPRNVRDDRYAARQAQATRAGLLWGAYHFANASDPVAQADFFLRTVASTWRAAGPGSRPEHVLLVLDFEKNGHYPGGTMRVDQAVRFIERIHERTGQYPGLYSNEHRVNTVLNSSSVTAAQRRVLDNCWLWVANYHNQPRNIAPWRRWMMWQYTGDGVCDLPRAMFPKSVANIRNAERNVFRGTASELRTFWENYGWRVGGAE
ncbi:MAG TPA: glycoside hydrolase family 25 protein [Chthoniobacterales bacterium]